MPFSSLHQWIPAFFLKAVCWTFIHSLWLGLAAALAAALIIHTTRSSAARLRYNLLAAVMITFVAAVALTFCLQLKYEAPVRLPLAFHAGEGIVFESGNAGLARSPQTGLQKFISYMNTHADVVVLTWAVLFFIQFVKLFTGLFATRRLRSRRTAPVAAKWLETLNYLRLRLQIRQTVLLLQSELVKVPAVIGYFKPVILVPLGLLSHLTPAQAETILLHELAHVRRNDFLMNILQRMVEAVFFFNPALIWISSLLRQEREACCDDIVVEHACDRRCYLEALVTFEEYSMQRASYAMGIASRKHYLLNRVRRLLTRENKKLNFMEKILLFTGITLVTAFTFIPRPGGTESKKASLTASAASRRPHIFSGPVEQKNAEGAAKIDARPLRKVQSRSVSPLQKDTVPPARDRQAKIRTDSLYFPSMTATTNITGKERTEDVTVRDQHGKTYTYTRKEGKIVSLGIDGKQVPDQELGDYADLIEKMERTREERIVLRQRQGEMTGKTREVQARLQELQQKLSLFRESQREQNKERIERQRERQKIASDQTRKRTTEALERLRQEKSRLSKMKAAQADQQRKIERSQRMRATGDSRLFRKSQETPTLNGREIIQSDEKKQPASQEKTAAGKDKNGRGLALRKADLSNGDIALKNANLLAVAKFELNKRVSYKKEVIRNQSEGKDIPAPTKNYKSDYFDTRDFEIKSEFRVAPPKPAGKSKKGDKNVLSPTAGRIVS